MGRTALSKLDDADRLDKLAAKIKQSDSASSSELKNAARGIRKRAITQMKARPRKRSGGRSGTGVGVSASAAGSHVDIG